MSRILSLGVVITTEFNKLRNCKILWSLPLCAILPDILIFIMYAFNKKYPIVVWDDYFTITITLLNILFAIGFFALLTGFIYSREYQENTVNSIFTYPISRIQFFIGKLIVILILISITLIFSFVLLVILGLCIKHEALSLEILFYYGMKYFLMIIMHFALVPISAFLSIQGKSIIPAIILGVIAMGLTFILVNTPYNTLFPWSIPAIFSPSELGRTYTNYFSGVTILCLTFTIGIVLSIKSINKDVH